MELTGTVKIKRFAPGSDSEHDAAMLVTDDGASYVLRRVGAHPFSDPVVRGLQGCRVRVEGRVESYLFLLEKFAVLDAGGEPPVPTTG